MNGNQQMTRIIPGLLLSFAVMMAGIYGADLLGGVLLTLGLLPEGSASPISGIFVAILLGILIRNLFGMHAAFTPGIAFSTKTVMKIGIVLLGLRLSLIEAVKLGAWGVPLIVACIASGLFITLTITKKLEQSPRLGTLIASGTGICGVTAIMATAPVIKARENEISYAVANITLFGLTGMLVYPYLAHFFFAGDPVKAGLFLGTAIHDTAQVTGAALIYSDLFSEEEVVNVATITKLTRNLFLIAVIPFVSALFFRKQDEENTALPKWYRLIPYFIIGFFLLSLVRTIGDVTAESAGRAYGLFEPAAWSELAGSVSSFGSTYLLGIAMAAVGLSTNLKIFKGMGLKPFAIGLIAALSVGAVSLILISLFGGYIAV